MSTTLGCMNCGKATDTNNTKFFAAVLLCPDCHTMAEHFYQRCEKELRYLLTMLKESIRVALLQKQFSFQEGPAGDVPKKAVLEEILRMVEAKNQHDKEPACPPSPPAPAPTDSIGDTTPPHVRTLAALGAGTLPKPPQRD